MKRLPHHARQQMLEHAEARREAVEGLRSAGLSVRAIANRLDCSASTVQSLLGR